MPRQRNEVGNGDPKNPSSAQPKLPPQYIKMSEKLDDDSELPKSKDGDVAKNSVCLLDEQIEKVLLESTMSQKDYDKRREMLKELETILNFGRVHPFGSFLTGIGSSSSDLDVYFEDFEKTNPFDILEDVAYALHHAKVGKTSYCRDILMFDFPDIRIPFVRFTHARLNIECDVSATNILAVQNSKLIKFLFSLTPVARPLTVLIREWARCQKLAKVKALKSYTIALLVISFLVREKILPSVDLLQSLVPPRIICGLWNVAFCDDAHLVKTHMARLGIQGDPTLPSNRPLTIMSLMARFFDMLKRISPSDVLCTVTGEFIPRDHFRPGNEDKLPPSQSRFLQIKKITKTWKYTQFPSNKPFAVQDPFDLTYNVTELCDKFDKIVEAAGETLGRIQFGFHLQNEFSRLFMPTEKPKNIPHGRNRTTIIFKFESYSFVLKLNENYKKIFLSNVTAFSLDGGHDSVQCKMSRLWYDHFLDFFKSKMNSCYGFSNQSKIKTESEVFMATKQQRDAERIGKKSAKKMEKNLGQKYSSILVIMPSEHSLSLEFSIFGSSKILQTVAVARESRKESQNKEKPIELVGDDQYEFLVLVKFQLVDLEPLVNVTFTHISTHGSMVAITGKRMSALPMSLVGPIMEEMMRRAFTSFSTEQLHKWFKQPAVKRRSR